jgi:hypothetical protein
MNIECLYEKYLYINYCTEINRKQIQNEDYILF